MPEIQSLLWEVDPSYTVQGQTTLHLNFSLD